VSSASLVSALKSAYARLPFRLVRRRSVDALSEAVIRLEREAGLATADLARTGAALAEVEAERDRLRHDLATYAERVPALEAEIADKTTVLVAWEAEIRDKSDALAQAHGTVDALEQERDRLLEEASALGGRLAQQEAALADARRECDGLKARIADVEADRAAIAAHNEDLLTERDKIRVHNGDLLARQEELEGAHEEFVRQAVYYRNQLDIAQGVGLHFQKALQSVGTGHPVAETPAPQTPDVSVVDALDIAAATKKDMAAVKSRKRAWLKKHLRCPACGGAGVRARQGDFACPDCGEGFSVTDNGTYNFISPALGIEHAIDPTGNVSAHGYDGAAIALINETAAAGGMTLDCGAGSKRFVSPHLVNVEIVDYPSTDLLAVGQSLPFRDGSFDAVISIAVLEHVTDPFACARELYRVVKPGGKLLISVPFLQPEHGYPHHYFNMTREGLRRLFRDMGDLENHWVPLSQHPLLSLAWFLAVYRVNIPQADREAFTRLTVGDFIDKDIYETVIGPVGAHLGQDGRWQLASGHSMLLRKPQA